MICVKEFWRYYYCGISENSIVCDIKIHNSPLTVIVSFKKKKGNEIYAILTVIEKVVSLPLIGSHDRLYTAWIF
jgi:hypothetical protein